MVQRGEGSPMMTFSPSQIWCICTKIFRSKFRKNIQMEYLFNSIFVLLSICHLLRPTPLETTTNVNRFYTRMVFGRSTPSEGSSMIMTFSQAKKGDTCTKFWIKKMRPRNFFFSKAENFDLKKHQNLVLLASGFWLAGNTQIFAKCRMLENFKVLRGGWFIHGWLS